MKSFLHRLDLRTLIYIFFFTILSFVFYLKLTDQPEITVHPQSQTTREGDNVTLSCDTIGNPAPTISWTRNGSLVDTSDNPRISFSADKKQVIITNVNRTDSGEYRCVARNIIGNDTSNAATLNLQCKFSVLFTKVIETEQVTGFVALLYLQAVYRSN